MLSRASDASYLIASGDRSHVGGHFFLGDKPIDPTKPPTITPKPNGPVLTIATIVKNVLASATEAKVGGLFIKCQEAVPICTPLVKMVHPQPATQSKLTTPPPTALSQHQYDNAYPKPMTCASTGFATASTKVNF